MFTLPRASRFIRWGACAGTIAVCLALSTDTLNGQLLRSIFKRKSASPVAPATAPPTTPSSSDGGFLAKQRYDSLTRNTDYDPAKLQALVTVFIEKQYPPAKGAPPKVPGAEMVEDDTLCATCHESYTKLHRTDIHRKQACEICHGPASEHLKTRGTKPGTIISFKITKPADQNEICLQCHDQHVKNRFVENNWRVSSHAHGNTACTACHKNHYTVPSGTPATQVAAATPQLPPKTKEMEADIKAIRATYVRLGAPKSQTCYQCHQDGPGGPQEPRIANMLMGGHPHQIDGPHKMACTTCHDPHGVLQKEVRTNLCIQCHQQNPHVMLWFGSSHAKAGMACVDCHNPHSPLPKLGAADANTCYKCHADKKDLELVAHPHQINGANNFTCSTCHNPHDHIRRESRTDQCLTCHKAHPTMAWKSSAHSLNNVACTDCHNPHPSSRLPRFTDISHTNVDRPKRMPMSVDEPLACYRCHPQIAAQFRLPFHHPVPEGKMLCSKCHNVHGGEGAKLLKEPTINLTCYKCHSSKQGPFVYEHPPVTENCDICHNPHGTVSNNLLKQPAGFLCLRCHVGHNNKNHVQLGLNPSTRAAFFTNCTQCHQQIHGSDLPGVGRNRSFFHR